MSLNILSHIYFSNNYYFFGEMDLNNMGSMEWLLHHIQDFVSSFKLYFCRESGGFS